MAVRKQSSSVSTYADRVLPDNIEETIRHRAYELFEHWGRIDGHDGKTGDWLKKKFWASSFAPGSIAPVPYANDLNQGMMGKCFTLRVWWWR